MGECLTPKMSSICSPFAQSQLSSSIHLLPLEFPPDLLLFATLLPPTVILTIPPFLVSPTPLLFCSQPSLPLLLCLWALFHVPKGFFYLLVFMHLLLFVSWAISSPFKAPAVSPALFFSPETFDVLYPQLSCPRPWRGSLAPCPLLLSTLFAVAILPLLPWSQPLSAWPWPPQPSYSVLQH